MSEQREPTLHDVLDRIAELSEQVTSLASNQMAMRGQLARVASDVTHIRGDVGRLRVEMAEMHGELVRIEAGMSVALSEHVEQYHRDSA